MAMNNIFADKSFMLSLGMSESMYERLHRNDVYNWDDFIHLTTETILSMSGFGSRTAGQIMPVVEAAKRGDAVIVKNAVRHFVLPFFDKLVGVTRADGEAEIVSRLPKSMLAVYGATAIFDEMLREGMLIEAEKGKYRHNWLNVAQYLQQYDGRFSGLLTEYLNTDQTLDDLARIQGCTKQYLSNEFNKIIDNMPKLYEDYVWDYIKNYDMTLEIVIFAFQLDDFAGRYLKKYKVSNRRKNKVNELHPGSRKLSYMELLNAEDTPTAVKDRMEEYALKNSLCVDGVFVPKSKADIFRFLVGKHCQNSITIEDFTQIYDAFIQKYNAQDFRYSSGSIRNEITDNYHGVLYDSSGTSIRAYDVDGVDIEELMQGIKFYEFKDVEITSNLFYDEYPDLMKELDIRNGYELHNLIKKRKRDIKRSDWSGKMPTMVFGKGDKRRQIRELLFQEAAEAPISKEDFISEYEKRYGKQGDGFYANDVHPAIGKYITNGEYSVDLSPLQDTELALLKPHFTERFYTIGDVSAIFRNALNKDGQIPDEELNKRINSYNMNKLGYKMRNSGAVFAVKYNTFDEAIRSYFKERKTVTLDSLGNINSNNTFISVFNKMCHEYEVIETAPREYTHISQLTETGITRESIEAFCESVGNMGQDGYFTLESLMQCGFTLPLQLTIVTAKALIRLSPLFDCFKIGNNYLFRRKGMEASQMDFLLSILAAKDSITSAQFIEILKEEYSISLDKYKIKRLLYSTDVYYSYRKDTFFKNYSPL